MMTIVGGTVGVEVGVLVMVGVRVFVGVRVLVGVRVSVGVRDGTALFVFVGIGPLVALPRGVFVGGGVAICAFPCKVCWLSKNRINAPNSRLKRNAVRSEKLMQMAFIKWRTKRRKYSK